MLRPNLLYLVYREALSSVFSSQVLTPLEEHRRYGPVSLGIHTPIGHLLRSKYRPALNAIEQRCQQASIATGWLPSPPTRTPWLWSDAFLLRQWVLRRFGQELPLIVRCRNAAMSCIAIDAFHGWQNVRVIYDCRGAEVTELTQQLGFENRPQEQWPAEVQRAVERARSREEKAATQSAGITCVSQAMVDVLRGRYPDLPESKFQVVPCCPDVAAFQTAQLQRETTRLELGLQDRFVVTYLGSLVWYQQPEASLRVFQSIRKLRPDAHFLAMTTEPDKMRALTQKAGIPSDCMTIMSVPARDVPRYLVASDAALMLRDQSETNQVASPVKFGEYLAAGVPVIITPRLGDASRLVESRQLGLVVDLNDHDHQLLNRLKEICELSATQQQSLRTRCSEIAQTEFSWSSLVPHLIEWYHDLVAHGCSTTVPALASAGGGQ